MAAEGGGDIVHQDPSHPSQTASQVHGTPSTALLPPGQCPPGMEYLIPTSMIFMKQLVEMLEVLTGFDTKNKFEILDGLGRRMYFAAETTGCCTRCILGSHRPFTVDVLDNMGQVVLKIERPCSCVCCMCGGDCFNEVRVSSAQNVLIGKVTQDCDCASSFAPRYTVYDAQNQKQLKIKGPCFCCMCCTVRFKLFNNDGIEIGEIQKKWGGVGKELLTSADTFGVSFPVGLDPAVKTILLGAVILIDFMHFEKRNQK